MDKPFPVPADVFESILDGLVRAAAEGSGPKFPLNRVNFRAAMDLELRRTLAPASTKPPLTLTTAQYGALRDFSLQLVRRRIAPGAMAKPLSAVEFRALLDEYFEVTRA